MAGKECERCGTGFTAGRGRVRWCEPCRTERFWDSVEIGGPDDCWPWTGAIKAHGYGKFYRGYEEWLTHRFAYHSQTGEELDPKDCVLHTCDNPPCCNPAHLFTGTREDNIMDMVGKNRQHRPIGVHNQNARLDADKVRLIRKEHAEGLSYRQLAARHNVVKTTIAAVLTGKTWRHVV